MSTRSQILFKFPDGQILIYRHSDGYPYSEAGVIADLEKFFKWNYGRNTQYDYMIANYFYWNKKHSEEYLDWDWKTNKKKRNPIPIHKRKMGGNEAVLLGHGLNYQGVLQGDIEWFYFVEFLEKPSDSVFKEDDGLTIIIKVYETHPFRIEYEYPEQLIKNELPKMTFVIENIPNLKLKIPDFPKYDEDEIKV